jgi:hypothetical protein
MRILCLLFWVHCNLTTNAQEYEKIKNITEAIAENVSDEEDLSELSEQLASFRNRPINLNRTNAEELKRLLLLSPLQISNFIQYSSNNRLLDVLELQAIPGFDIETINSMLPFVTLAKTEQYKLLKPGEMLRTANHDLILRYSSILQQQKGFKDIPGSRYLGSAEKLLFRYRYDFQQLVSAALIMEKDAGEQLFNNKKGADHLSAHIALFKLGRITKLVIGDYSLQFGQGLTLWSGFSFGKGPDVTSVAAKDAGLKPYTSANESAFFRGAAGSMHLAGNVLLTPFLSFRNLDASLKASPEGGFNVANINISGLHRTVTELKNQGSLPQRVYGGALQYITDQLNIGVIGYHSVYKHQFTTGNQEYNKYAFEGKNLTNIGFHYNYTFRNIYLYGEIAHSMGSGKAMINGAMASLSPRISAVILHRNYDKTYHNFFSSAIGEGTETNNEQGWYAGLNYRLPGSLTLSLYGDYFKFPWLKYRVNAPSSGYEILSQLAYTRGKIFKAVVRFKREQKQQNPDANSSNKRLENVIKYQYRLEWNLKINQKFNFHQRAEMAKYQKGIKKTETGFLIYQDAAYTPLSSRISGNIRIAFFNTPSYNSRIYAYEDNVLYSSGSGVYSGKGSRAYVNARYKLISKMDVWARYAIYFYQGIETIGSGLDEIAGNKKSEVKLQLRYQF